MQRLTHVVLVRRVFDSAPPAQAVTFWKGGRRIFAVQKAEGIFLFLDETDQTLEIRCKGYQPERVELRAGHSSVVRLYPSAGFVAEPGWKVWRREALPGRVQFCPDERFTLRLLEANSQERWVRLWARPGFLGGCLLFSGVDSSSIALILEKQPPDRFRLDRMDGPFDQVAVRHGYVARADASGGVALVLPDGFTPGEEILSESSW